MTPPDPPPDAPAADEVLPVAMRNEQISERDLDALCDASKTTPAVVDRLKSAADDARETPPIPDEIDVAAMLRDAELADMRTVDAYRAKRLDEREIAVARCPDHVRSLAAALASARRDLAEQIVAAIEEMAQAGEGLTRFASSASDREKLMGVIDGYRQAAQVVREVAALPETPHV